MQTSTARYECLTRCFIAIAGLLFANSCLSTAMKCTLNAAVLVVVVAAAHFATGVIGGVGIPSLKESTGVRRGFWHGGLVENTLTGFPSCSTYLAVCFIRRRQQSSLKDSRWIPICKVPDKVAIFFSSHLTILYESGKIGAGKTMV